METTSKCVFSAVEPGIKANLTCFLTLFCKLSNNYQFILGPCMATVFKLSNERRHITTLYLCTERFTILSRWSPNVSNFLFVS